MQYLWRRYLQIKKLIMKKITICIPTHCVKTERKGPWAGMNNNVPSAPSSRMIETVINDLFSKTDIKPEYCQINIGLDKRRNRHIDNVYEHNLSDLLSKYGGKLIINESDIDDPIETAPNNFKNLIDSVETEYYLFWEHDWILNKFISINDIINEMNSNSRINYIRFSQNNTIPDEYIAHSLDNEIISEKIPLTPTIHWSNNPYICRTEIWKKWWVNFIYPTDEFGGFVEGPMNVFYKFYISKMGEIEASNRFKCFIYGIPSDVALVSHLNGNNWI